MQVNYVSTLDYHFGKKKLIIIIISFDVNA